MIWCDFYRFSPEEAMVVDKASFLLKIELNPVVKTNKHVIPHLANKDMLKAARV